MSITVTRVNPAHTVHEARIRAHVVPLDMSVAEGGLDEGPDPHDIYDAALGACKALTLVWYAARKNIPLADVAVTVDRDAQRERQGEYVLTTTLLLGGPLSDTQRQELLAVAEKCPIHKLMTGVETVIHTKLAQ